jgi:hypothetical protein
MPKKKTLKKPPKETRDKSMKKRGKESKRLVAGATDLFGVPSDLPFKISMIASPSQTLQLRPLPDQFQLGRGLLTPPPGVRATAAPVNWENHPLIRGTCFYTLPGQLLTLVETHAKSWPLHHEKWLLEKALAEICGDHSTQVGFNDGQPIEYHLLRAAETFQLSAEQLKSMNWEGMNDAKIASVQRAFQPRRKWYHSAARGYAGWLNCNAEFRREREAALGMELRVVKLIPDMAASVSCGTLPERVRSFLIRWRLLGMAGPRLPIPMQPMMSGMFPVSILPQLMDAGGVFNIPDICPLPSREELRDMLEEAIRRDKPGHLVDWQRVIAKDNTAKTEIARYGRLLEVQHYWELFHERHGDHLKRKLSALQSAIATILGASLTSIEGDIRFLRKRLGRAWLR